MFWCGRRMVYIESGWIRYLYVTVWGCIYGRTEWRRWVSFAVDQIKWRQVLSLDREVLLFGGTASWPGLWIQWDVIWGSDFRQSFWVSYELALDHQIAGPGPLPEAGPAKCALTQGDLTVMIFWILPDPWRIPTREQEDNLLNQLFFLLAKPTCWTFTKVTVATRAYRSQAPEGSQGLFSFVIQLKLPSSCYHLLSCVTFQGLRLFCYSVWSYSTLSSSCLFPLSLKVLCLLCV